MRDWLVMIISAAVLLVGLLGLIRVLDGQRAGLSEPNPMMQEQGFLVAPPVFPAAATVIEQRYKLTFYSCSVEEQTQDCITASGVPAGPGTVASNDLPFGTILSIAGRGVYTVTDRGGGLSRGHLDVWMPSRAEALREGVQEAVAIVIGEGVGER